MNRSAQIEAARREVAVNEDIEAAMERVARGHATTVFDELREERDRELLTKLREARAEHMRLLALVERARKDADAAGLVWFNLREQASDKVLFQHAQDRVKP